ncbi:MAG: flagellar hook-basal body complex protein FliE [Desulfobacca sp.]|nr:flagellar hook-basal body complex protein FliE [Desulfobacca sp.]
MTDIKNISSISGLNSLQGKASQPEKGENFEALLKEAIHKVNTVQNDAEKAIQELANGGDVTSAVIAMEKADLSFQVMTQVRNKLITAYEEVMRLQI